jgi:hypothetical protein
MDPEATAHALELVQRLQDDCAAQRIVLRRGTLTEHASLLARFGAAGHVVAADPAVVPDWLHTRDYLLATAGPLSERNTKAAMALQRKRQRLMATPGFRFEFFVFESALRTRVGSLRVMADQVQDIAAKAGHCTNVAVRLVNDDAVVTPPPSHGFELHDDRQVVFSTVPGVVVITSHDDVQPFRLILTSMRTRALSETRSRHYLRQIGGLYDVLDRIETLAPFGASA